MSLSPEDISWFKLGEYENPKFWTRFGGQPPLKDACVLDIGCGYGSLCIDMGLTGAKKVVGIDIDSYSVNVANEILRQDYPQLVNRVEFKCMELADYDEYTFDFIVSKDSFEHIMNLGEILRQMKRCLKPGGKIYVGFSPLYNSPFGGHEIAEQVWGFNLPWGHLLLNETVIITRLSRCRREKINSVHDIGLNKNSLADYRKIFHESDLTIPFFATNCSNKFGSKIMSLIAKIPPLEEYFTHNIYCILTKET